jgi:hypothetical protein
MPLNEFLFRFPIQRFRLNPAIEPRQIVGSLQQRLWTMRIQPSDDLIPDNTQQDGQQQTGSNAKAGGRCNSHSGPFTLASILPECAAQINISTSIHGGFGMI